MNFSGKTILVFLEEDNIQRAYFRVRPLLSDEGALDKAAAEQFPDEGYLRIVPDKNEQHTFKERMRTLCGLCVVDLSALPPEVNKIRTNKNYSPARGENNQFIVYSDAVQPLPRDVFFQVVSEKEVQTALTPLVYTRNGANIQGPFDHETGAPAGDTVKLPPDSADIHSVTLPDGRELLFYCSARQPRSEAPAAPAQETAAEATIPSDVPAAPAANAGMPAKAVSMEKAPQGTPSPWQKQLDAIMHGEPEPAQPTESRETPAEKPAEPKPQPGCRKPDMQSALAQIQALNGELNVSSPMKESPVRAVHAPAPASGKPLVGTRLYAPLPVRRVSAPRAHNSLAETVELQRNVNRYETRYEAPGAVIAANAPMSEMQNPVEQFRRSLQKVWQMPDTHRQVVDALLGAPGIRQSLTRALCDGKSDLTITAMHSQLQELEAERLMLLMQLDDVKNSRQKIKNELLSELAGAEKDAQEKLEALTREKRACVDALNVQQAELLKECDAALEKLADTPWQTLLVPRAGAQISGDELVRRTLACLKAQGFLADEDDARALLTVLALTDNGQLLLAADSLSDAHQAALALAAALGVPCRRIYEKELTAAPVRVPEGGDAPALTCGNLVLDRPIPRAVHLALADKQMSPLSQEGSAAGTYRADPVLCADFATDDSAVPSPLPSFPAVSFACLRQEMLSDESRLTDDTQTALHGIYSALREAGAPLPLTLRRKLQAFVAATQDRLKGGVAAALDYGVRAVVLPHAEAYALEKDLLRPVMSALPRSLKGLNA
ncbi:MAG: hypothetical protein MR021_08030 [Clostridiales bacterium]|nr:hypothetical protein [Clostridiales bacterium]